MTETVEEEIVSLVKKRLERGFDEYGKWEMPDGRDYKKEALEEVLDCMMYCAAALIELDKTPGMYKSTALTLLLEAVNAAYDFAIAKNDLLTIVGLMYDAREENCKQ